MYIQLHDGMKDHPKIRRLCAMLKDPRAFGLTADEVIGLVVGGTAPWSALRSARNDKRSRKP